MSDRGKTRGDGYGGTASNGPGRGRGRGRGRPLSQIEVGPMMTLILSLNTAGLMQIENLVNQRRATIGLPPLTPGRFDDATEAEAPARDTNKKAGKGKVSEKIWDRPFFRLAPSMKAYSEKNPKDRGADTSINRKSSILSGVIKRLSDRFPNLEESSERGKQLVKAIERTLSIQSPDGSWPEKLKAFSPNDEMGDDDVLWDTFLHLIETLFPSDDDKERPSKRKRDDSGGGGRGGDEAPKGAPPVPTFPATVTTG